MNQMMNLIVLLQRSKRMCYIIIPKDNLEDTKNLHENEINLNKTFEAEVSARLFEPLDS